jgi:uncharacterized Zn finger protein (UPF0148 family)
LKEQKEILDVERKLNLMMTNERNSPHICPVCGNHEFKKHDSFDICPVCGWEDDLVQELDPDFDAGPNGMSLNEFKMRFESRF